MERAEKHDHVAVVERTVAMASSPVLDSRKGALLPSIDSPQLVVMFCGVRDE